MQFSKAVGSIEVKYGVVTHGAEGQSLVKGVLINLPADAIRVKPGGETPLTNISVISKQGIAVQISKGKVTNRTGLTANGAKGDIVEN